mmetsp:Transcript_40864/g.80531  ORF Transcript_40864/g.80531 Transcript_40864/m.80531 type:complete len:191 (+) Transcript_40864:2652-3224(+)
MHTCTQRCRHADWLTFCPFLALPLYVWMDGWQRDSMTFSDLAYSLLFFLCPPILFFDSFVFPHCRGTEGNHSGWTDGRTEDPRSSFFPLSLFVACILDVCLSGKGRGGRKKKSNDSLLDTTKKCLLFLSDRQIVPRRDGEKGRQALHANGQKPKKRETEGKTQRGSSIIRFFHLTIALALHITFEYRSSF